MKPFSRLTLLVLSAALFLSLPAMLHAQDFKYQANGDGTCTITRYHGSGDALTIPDSLDGMLVTRIGGNAFYGCKSKNITLPNSVTNIGARAFTGCANLTNVTIPDSVVRISNDAFGGCSSLDRITIPASVKIIDRAAFQYCRNLTSVTIGAACIGTNAFDFCTNLTSVTLLNSVNIIGFQAFQRCARLTSITIPDSVTTIRAGAFAYTGLSTITLPNSIICSIPAPI